MPWHYFVCIYLGFQNAKSNKIIFTVNLVLKHKCFPAVDIWTGSYDSHRGLLAKPPTRKSPRVTRYVCVGQCGTPMNRGSLK